MSVLKAKDPVTGEWLPVGGSGGSSGANTLTVTITDDVASHTSAEIYAHVQAGGTAVWRYEDYATDVFLDSCDESMAVFCYKNGEEGMLIHLAIYDDGSYDLYNQSYATQAVVEGRLGEKITRPYPATTGQTIVVKDVNSQGYPTAWKCVDLPSGGGADLIMFRIDMYHYLAEDGMTWGEWIESKYNTGEVSLDDGGYVFWTDTEDYIGVKVGAGEQEPQAELGVWEIIASGIYTQL